MKCFGVMAVVVVGTCAWAGHAGQTDKPGQTDKRLVTLCMNLDGNVTSIFRGQATATRIFAQAGIRLKWRTEVPSCSGLGNDIVIIVSHDISQDPHPATLAYAMLPEASRIVLYLDRVLNLSPPGGGPGLLGYALAHEIAHILQGVNRHSASGIMKALWDKVDYAGMHGERLRFTQEDILLIRGGLDRRASRAAQP